jgi:DNA-binding LacI/PurR family transcriptional regulator
MALGVVDRLRHERGIDIPGRLQIVGFDDIEQAGWSAYDLSTIRQEHRRSGECGRRAGDERLEHPDRPFETRSFGLQVVFRGTTRGTGAPKPTTEGDLALDRIRPCP